MRNWLTGRQLRTHGRARPQRAPTNFCTRYTQSKAGHGKTNPLPVPILQPRIVKGRKKFMLRGLYPALHGRTSLKQQRANVSLLPTHAPRKHLPDQRTPPTPPTRPQSGLALLRAATRQSAWDAI